MIAYLKHSEDCVHLLCFFYAVCLKLKVAILAHRPVSYMVCRNLIYQYQSVCPMGTERARFVVMS